MTGTENRCRLMLILPEGEDIDARRVMLEEALRGGDVASVVLPQYALEDGIFQKHAEALVPVIQKAGAAALIEGDTRVAGRAKADGIHIAGGLEAMAEAIGNYSPKLIVGGGNAKDRHIALQIGDLAPDYIFFGKIGGDIKPEPHSKNLALAEWWASMVEVPCVVMGGTDPQSALAVAETGAEFVALCQAVFSEPRNAAQVVASVNALLDEKAPRFED
ncbi:MAG TPA: thiamine phosphate synthase [Mycoplana sp.]|nr:thiamine phosphate synthase [Mycoplana sp.]